MARLCQTFVRFMAIEADFVRWQHQQSFCAAGHHATDNSNNFYNVLARHVPRHLNIALLHARHRRTVRVEGT